MLEELDALAQQYNAEHSTAQSVANLVGVRETQQEQRREKAATVGKKGQTASGSAKKAAGECWKWSDGTCHRGEECRFKHSGQSGHGKNPPYYRKEALGPGQWLQGADAEGGTGGDGAANPKSNAARALVTGIVADTGAAVRVIGAVHRHFAQNGRALVRSVLVDTAREADLPLR